MELIAWIASVITMVIGVVIIIFPSFFVELSQVWDNEFLYWIGAGFTFNNSKTSRVLMRIYGGALIIIGLWVITTFLI